jgi:regulator of PEP synthase PpsR (kinase-PPPase family)
MERRSSGGTIDPQRLVSDEPASSCHKIQQAARSTYQHLAASRGHRRHAVVNDNEPELDETFEEIGLREAIVRYGVAKCAQGCPLVRRKIEIDVVVHVASSDINVRAPLLAALHEDRATTMSPEFGWLFRTPLHKLPHFVAPQELRSATRIKIAGERISSASLITN